VVVVYCCAWSEYGDGGMSRADPDWMEHDITIYNRRQEEQVSNRRDQEHRTELSGNISGWNQLVQVVQYAFACRVSFAALC
jgi:hypothetical protein